MIKKRHQMLRKGLETIAREYATFLQKLYEKSEELYDPKELRPLSDEAQELLKDWLKDQLNKIQDTSRTENSESHEQEESLILLKEKYDNILHVGTCASLLGKSPKIVTEAVPAFELFSAYHEFLEAGLCQELTREEIETLSEKSQEFLNIDVKDTLSFEENKEKEIFRDFDSMKDKINEFEEENEEILNINLKFERGVMNEIRRLVPLLEVSENKKEAILEKAEDILDKYILRAARDETIIHKDTNPLKNAMTIIYAVLVSNENMPNISQTKLSKIAEINQSTIAQLYNKYYKILARKLDFDFQSAQFGRNAISFYFFELLIDTKIDRSEIVLRLKEIVININTEKSKQLTLKEDNLIKQLTKRNIKSLQELAIHYSDTFIKYFSDLVKIIKLLIISIKYHRIMGANFSIGYFATFLMSKGIDLFCGRLQFTDIIGELFGFLNKTKYYDLFPVQTHSDEKGISTKYRIDVERKIIVGNRIKLYIIKNIYSGKYFDSERGIVICPDCSNEGFTINTSFPRVRSKDLHHEDIRIDGYSVNEIYKLFLKNRGNPYFLPDLIKKMESESVVLLCGCHHQTVHATRFNDFKKLISWENIPKDFPQDIFDLPAEIIYMLAMICVDNFSSTRTMDLNQKLAIRRGIIHKLKKRYIIDRIYGGLCPVCGEFNTIDYLPAFDFAHLKKVTELTPVERRRREKNKISDLIKVLSCSELVKEIINQQGAYICSNCHRVLHADIELTIRIYDDKIINKTVIDDIKKVIEKHRRNLINNADSINNPLELDIRQEGLSLMEYLFAFFEISEEKGAVTSVDLEKRMGFSRSAINKFFDRRKRFLEKCGRIIPSKGRIPIRYYLSDDGKNYVRLINYFRNYYKNLSF